MDKKSRPPVETDKFDLLCKRTRREDGITVEILEALSPAQIQALAENVNERCRTFQFDEGITNAAADLFTRGMGARHLDKCRPTARLTALRKLKGYFGLITMEKIRFGCSQTVFVADWHPPQGASSILLPAERQSVTSHSLQHK